MIKAIFHAGKIRLEKQILITMKGIEMEPQTQKTPEYGIEGFRPDDKEAKPGDSPASPTPEPPDATVEKPVKVDKPDKPEEIIPESLAPQADNPEAQEGNTAPEESPSNEEAKDESNVQVQQSVTQTCEQRTLPVNHIRSGRFDQRDAYHKKKRIAQLVRQMKQTEQCRPLLVIAEDTDGYYELLDGHCRYGAALELGWEKIQAFVLKGKSNEDLFIEAVFQNETFALDPGAKVAFLVDYIDERLQCNEDWLSMGNTKEECAFSLAKSCQTILKNKEQPTSKAQIVFMDGVRHIFKPRSLHTPISNIVVPWLALQPEMASLARNQGLPMRYIRALKACQGEIVNLPDGEHVRLIKGQQTAVVREDGKLLITKLPVSPDMPEIPQIKDERIVESANKLIKSTMKVGSSDGILEQLLETIRAAWRTEISTRTDSAVSKT